MTEQERPPVEKSPEVTPGYRPVERALLSVYYKDGIVELARGLHEEGVEIISTGGTYGKISKAGIPVTEVADITQFPEMMGGRVKTLHPKIFAGILADRSKGEHLREMAQQGIAPIDLVVVNLYPFEEEIAKTDDPLKIIEKIDVGGPSMIRGAAKNLDSVASVCDPEMYPEIVKEIKENGGLSQALRARCMVDAFTRTAEYDEAIRQWASENFEALSTLVKEFEPEETSAAEAPAITDEEARALTRQALGG